MSGVEEEPTDVEMFENKREWLRQDPALMEIDQSMLVQKI